MSFARFTALDGRPVFVNCDHIIAVETVNLTTTIYLTSSGSTGKNLAFAIREEQSLALSLASGSWLARLRRWVNERTSGQPNSFPSRASR